MKILFSIIWIIYCTKLLFFWVWLWQLKEYHYKRLIAHFETQKIRKFLYSFKGLKYPAMTKKTIAILVSGIAVEFIILFYFFSLPDSLFYSFLLILIFLAPLMSFLLVAPFQIVTEILIKKDLRKAGEKIKKFKNLLVVGVTGSYGKTSTKEFLAEILSGKFKVLKTKKHVNTWVGIARAILDELEQEHQVFIAEIGAYDKGKIKEVCQMLHPKIGILTGINEQHLSTFGSQENIISTKYELIESLPEDGVAFFNAKNKYCLELYQKTKIKKILYGEESTSPGKENILGAIAVAEELGMTEEEISRARERIKDKFTEIQAKKGRGGLNIIDTTYSANPDGVLAHLEHLKNFSGRKIIIMPCLIELGSASKEIHKKIGKKIAEVCDLAIITTKDYFKEIKQNEDKITLIERPREIIEKINNFCRAGDIVLLEGRIPKEVIKNLII